MADSDQKMLIHWIVTGVTGDAESGYRSKLASNRYRAIFPAEGLRQRGHSVSFVNADTWRPQENTSQPRPDAVVIGKLLPGANLADYMRASERLRAAASYMCTLGCTVIADINDDHFQHPQLGAHWRGLLECVNGITAGSGHMAERIREFTNLPVIVVGDPVGAPIAKPSVFDRGRGLAGLMQRSLERLGYLKTRLRLVWYGSHTNWPAMAAWAEKLLPMSHTQPFLIKVISTPGMGIEVFADKYNAANHPDALMQFIEWEVDSVWDHVAEADIVLIPSELGDQRKTMKTANRLLDALACGRFPVASPVPAYKEYSDYGWLGEDPALGVEWVLANPALAMRKLELGQRAALAKAGDHAIAHAWEQAIMDIGKADGAGREAAVDADEPSRALRIQPQVGLRLNLGCGDKILTGYVNVDVAPSRGGKTPDMICDLHTLDKFETDMVDEILAVHVIEHFWRWEVVDILKEWVRVLKPGGVMILECPNLASACQEFLKDAEAFANADQRGQRTMWVFYGDPAWEDPLMIHRWGYTPSSLGAVMREAGLIEVRQEPAQFKLREPRDMRIVGVKPMLERMG